MSSTKEPEITESQELPRGKSTDSRGLSAPPAVGRVAGLTRGALASFSSPGCAAILDSRPQLLEELETLKAELVGIIESRLTEFDGTARRALLSIKRDSFNQRPLRKYRTKPAWEDLSGLAPESAKRILAIEDQLEESDRRFAELYERELFRERLHTVKFLENRDLLRGIAIGRPGLVQKARSKSRALASSKSTKPVAKWEESLLRFVIRAATKLSANSTLTSYTLGSLNDPPPGTAPLERLETRDQVSLVRVDRPPIEQFQTLLFKHPAARHHAWITWNDSAEELEPGTFRFVRDRHWKFDNATGEFSYSDPSRLKVKFPASFQIPAIHAALVSEDIGVVYADLLDRLENEIENAGNVLEQLLNVGFLILLPPWPSHEAWLEQRMSDFLRPIAKDDEEMRGLSEALDELVSLEKSFAEADFPERRVLQMQEAFNRLMQLAAPRSAASAESPVGKTTRSSFYEDVLQIPGAEAEMDRGCFELGSDAAEKLLRVVGLVAHFDSLFNLRHDVTHTLAAWWRTHEPDRREIPFEELIKNFAPIWKSFPEFQRGSKANPREPWAPLDSPALSNLREHRAWAISRINELLADSPGKDTLSADSLQALVESLPDRYAPLMGPSVFCQPADPEGSTWVLNNINEGTGRYLSRVTPMLRGEHRERFLGHLAARSTVEIDGEEADLLEVKDPWWHLVRAHAPQTARVLDLRGVHLDLPPERRVSLDEIVVQADLEAESFRLVDRAGRRVLPVSVSTAPNSGLSNKLQFLLMFGVGETRGIFPFPWSHTENGVTVIERLTCENVVLRRKSWQIPIADLRHDLAKADHASRFKIINLWRHRLQLPAEGYFFEKASCGKNKPQYLRFDSPFLCRLFIRSLLQTEGDTVSFLEPLPAPSDYPSSSDGQQQAFELLLDQLPIRRLPGSRSQ